MTAARPARSRSTPGRTLSASRRRRAPTSPTTTCRSPASSGTRVVAEGRGPTVIGDRLQRAGGPVHDHEHAQGSLKRSSRCSSASSSEAAPRSRRSGATRTRTPSRSRSRSARRTGSRPPRRTAASRHVFEPGRLAGAFQTPFVGAPHADLDTRHEDGHASSSSSTRCTATLELRKVTVPADDPGLFNLLVNGQLLGDRRQRHDHRARSRSASARGRSARQPGRAPTSPTTTRRSPARETARRGVGPGNEGRRRGRERRRRRLHLHEHPQVNRPADPAWPAAARRRRSPRYRRHPRPPPPLGDLSVVKTASPTTAVLGQKITLDGQGHEQLDGRGGRRERGQGLRAVLPR